MLAAGAGSLAISLLLLPAHLGLGDPAEFTLALALAGIPHPTGYPLYVLAGHGFVVALHAAGVPWVAAAALWSAAGAAIAVGAMVRLAQHLLAAAGPSPAAPRGVERLAAMLPAGLVALNPVWIRSATIAEVYSWHHAALALTAACAAGLLRRIDAEARGVRTREAMALGLLLGLGAAHHASFALFGVPLALAVGVAHRRAGGRAAEIAPLFVALLPAVAGAAWLLWRAGHPAAYQWPLEPDAGAVLRHLTGAAYAGYVGRFAPSLAEWATIQRHLLPWLLPGLFAAVVGALRLPGPAFRLGGLALIAGAALVVAAVTIYGVPDPAFFFLSPLMIAVLVAAPLVRAIATRFSPWVAGVAGLALLLGLASAAIPAALRDRAQLARVDARIRTAWAMVPFERGLVIWNDDHLHRLRIFQQLESSRTGLDLVSPNALTWAPRREAFVRRYGFDPVAGAVTDGRADPRAIAAAIMARSPVPAVEFPTLIERVPRADR